MALLPSCKKDDNKSQTGTTEEKKDTRAVYPVNEKVNPFTWIAIDGQGNTIDPDNSGYKDANQNKKKQVAIFYFLWHGCHGYDKGANHNDVVPKVLTTSKNSSQTIRTVPNMVLSEPCTTGVSRCSATMLPTTAGSSASMLRC